MTAQDEEVRAEDVLPSPREHLTSATTRHVVRIQNAVLQAARDTLRDAGFVELLTPIIGPVTDPGIRGSKQVDIDYYGNRYRLMTSAILYKQASLLAFDKVYCLAPNVRMEPLETASAGISPSSIKSTSRRPMSAASRSWTSRSTYSGTACAW